MPRDKTPCGMVTVLLLCVIWIHPSTSTDLQQSYTENTTLSSANSPYYVVSDIVIYPNTTLSIDNGVAIVFFEDYTIDVQGSIDACNAFDSGYDGIIGLANTNEYIHIYSNNSTAPNGRVSVSVMHGRMPGFATFCNAKFEGMYYAVSDRYSIYNSEFIHMEYATYDTSAAVISTITRSSFENVENVNYGVGVIYDACNFKLFNQFFSYSSASSIAMRNNHIYGDSSINTYCIRFTTYTGDASQAMYNNVIDSCGYGIYVVYASQGNAANGLIIQNNTITNCTAYGMSVQNYRTQIRYNTFMDNANFDVTSRGRGSYIEYNKFIRSGNIALEMKYCDNITVSYNTFMHGNGRSIYGQCNSFTYVESNTFSENKNPSGWGLVTTTTSAANYYYINRNSFISNTGELIIDARNGYWYEITNNYFYNNTLFAYDAALIHQSTSYSPYVHAHLINNTIVNNHIIASSNGAIYYLDCGQNGGSCATSVIKHNTIRNNIVEASSSTYLFSQNGVISLQAVASVTIQYNELSNNLGDSNETTIGSNVILFVDNNQVSSRIGVDIQFNHFNETVQMNAYVFFYFYLDVNTVVENNNFYSFANINHYIAPDDIYQVDLQSATHNYYGTENISIIQSKLFDGCTVSNHGYVTWHPFYRSPIDFDPPSVPATKFCNYTVNRCNVMCYDAPTVSPTTGAPTTDPTYQPTGKPTTDPTVDPTVNPSATQTMVPSTAPIIASMSSTETAEIVTLETDGSVILPTTPIYFMMLLLCFVLM
eukprot:146314_1